MWREDLELLLVDLFPGPELHAFVSGWGAGDHGPHLPADTVPPTEIARKAVARLEQAGQVDAALFDALGDRFPRRRAEVDRVRGAWERRSVALPRTAPPGPFRHLDDDTLKRVKGAILSGGLATQADALLAGIDPRWVATLAAPPQPMARLLATLQALNTVQALPDGQVPLATWLQNAADLVWGRPEAAVFEEARDRLRSSS